MDINKLIVDEQSIPEAQLPGRALRWVMTQEDNDSQFCSACVIRVAPGQKVKPAHAHPGGEEMLYIISGSGKVLIDGEVGEVKAGCAVLFPKASIHMLYNSGDEEMKVVCFYAPATKLSEYEFHEEVVFPED